MQEFINIIENNQEYLVECVREYERLNGFSKYTSNFEKVSIMAISGLSKAMIEAINKDSKVPEFVHPTNVTSNPIAAFGILEANRHCHRDVRLDSFIGLLKFYRKAYLDLIEKYVSDVNQLHTYWLFINGFFDENEIAYIYQWTKNYKRMEEESITIIKTTIDAFWLNDLNGKFVEVNDSFCDTSGYSRSELLSMSIDNIVVNETKEDVLNRISLIKSSGYIRFESTVKKKDGTRIEVEASASYLPSSGLICSFGRDITERKQSQELLARSEEQLGLLVSQMQQGLAVHEIICDENGNVTDFRFLSVNESFEKLIGLKKNNIIGKTAGEVLSEDEKYLIEVFGKVATTGEATQFDIYFARFEKYFNVSVYSPRKNQFAVILSDITEKRKSEEKIISLSYHDQLTGLYNRRFYEEEILRLNSDEKSLPLAIVMADINGLKLANDVFGHEVGDKLIYTVAQKIKKGCRERDIIARVGGDEFVILLPQTDSINTKRIIDRIEDSLVSEKNEDVIVSVSMGYSIRYNMLTDIKEVFNVAEDNMYQKKLFESVIMRRKTIHHILDSLFQKNKRELMHYENVSRICRAIATELGMDRDKIEKIEKAGFMHDIGKIGINLSMLNKPEKLEPYEWAEVKRHSELGYRILNSVDEYSDIARYVLEHHEWFNGNGYPKGLRGDEITLQARIITLADAFDAMTTERKYKKVFSYEEAIEEIKANSGIQFDPQIVEVFLERVLPKLESKDIP